MAIPPHAQFLAHLHGAPQDVCLPILEDLLNRGYDMTHWETNAAATDGPCLVKDGDLEGLSEFLARATHSAPIFSSTHVGCKCRIKVTGPGLSDVWVSANGIVDGTPGSAIGSGVEEPNIAESQPEVPIEKPQEEEPVPPESKEG